MTNELEFDGEKQPLVSKANEEAEPAPSILDDALDTLTLGIPIFISRLSFVGVRTSANRRCVSVLSYASLTLAWLLNHMSTILILIDENNGYSTLGSC
jgi:hypothetical protein